ncbi:MAG: hypothetical protein ACR2NM_05630, partial [Bythopirellula sp.]
MSKSQPIPGASVIMKRYGSRAGPGARPGSIHIPEGAIPPQLHVTCYDADNLAEHEHVSLSQLKELRGRSEVMWIDIVG